MKVRNPLSDDIYLKRREAKDYSPRTDFFRDQTAIIHSMPFRRLKQKTQVFFSPQNDHVCTRIEHVLHVATIAATICKGLNKSGNGWELNEELAFAIGLGHDLGHAPFGHPGEKKLNELLGGKNSFIHEINGYRTVEYLANYGEGLNLTYAVKDGIICHCGEKFEQFIEPRNDFIELDRIKERNFNPSTFEGCIVRFSDKIAYFGRDIEDAILANFIDLDEVPDIIRDELGENNGEIINTLVNDLIQNSQNKKIISFSDAKHKIIQELKAFNYSKIYNHQRILKWRTYGERIIETIFAYLQDLFCNNGWLFQKYSKETDKRLDVSFGNYLKKMEKFYKVEDTPPARIVADYIAGMTDDYALKWMQYISLPEPIEM